MVSPPISRYFFKLLPIELLLFIKNYLFIVLIGELTLNYLPKTYIVKLQTLQMAILLLFEDCDTLKYSEIYDLLQVTNDEYKDHLESLVKYKLLLLNGDVSKLIIIFNCLLYY